MEGAKDLAKDMLAALDLENEGMLVAYLKGIIDFPVNMYFLGYDFIHTEDRAQNRDDNMRIAELVHRATSKKNLNFIAKAVEVFIDDFMEHVNMQEILKNMAENTLSSALGSYTFSELTGLKTGQLISSKIVPSIMFSMSVSALLTIGGAASRAIHTSRMLRTSNYEVYRKLRSLGDLDLLYFAIKDRIAPFEKATRISRENPALFNQTVEYFFKGL